MSEEKIKALLADMQDEDKWDGSEMSSKLIKLVDQPSLYVALAKVSLAAMEAVIAVRDEFIANEINEDETDKIFEHATALCKRCVLTPKSFAKYWQDALDDEWADADGGVIDPFTHFYIIFETVFSVGCDDVEFDFNDAVKDRIKVKLAIVGDKVEVKA